MNLSFCPLSFLVTIRMLSLGIALLTTAFAQAQFPTPIRCKIFVPPIQGILTENSEWAEVPSSVQVTTTEGVKTLRLSRNGYSETFVVPPNGKVIVSRMTEDSRRAPTPWIHLQLDPEVREALILVEPGTEDEAGQVKAEVLDVSASQFKDANIAFHNFLDNPVRLTLGEDEILLPPKGRQLLELKDGRIRIFLEEIDGSRGRRYTGAVHIRKESPTLVTIRPNPASARRLDVSTFSGMPEDEG